MTRLGFVLLTHNKPHQVRRLVDRRLRPSWRPVALPCWLSRLLLPFSRTFRCHAGSQWFSANRKAALRLLDFHAGQPALARHYSRVWCADESYFHCVLCNDPALGLVNDNKRYTAWIEGNPNPMTLGLADLPKVLASGCHFARKFDLDQDSDVLDALDAHLGVLPTAQER